MTEESRDVPRGVRTDESHPFKSRIQDLDYRGDTATARSLRKEAQRTLDHQLAALNDIDSKAISILRVNTLVIGLVLSVVSILAESSNEFTVGSFYNVYMFAGVAAFLLSSMVSAATYTASDAIVGFSDETIHGAIDADLTADEFEVGAASSYGHWIAFNDVTNIKNAPLITITAGLMILGILNLSLGVYSAVIDQLTQIIAGGAYLAYAVILYVTGLSKQVRRWSKVTDQSWPMSRIREFRNDRR